MHRQREALGQFQEPVVDRVLLGDAVGLKLQVEAAREERGIEFCQAAGLVHAAADDGPGDLAREAGGERDEALVVRGQKLVVHARLVVEALAVARGHELEQVLVAAQVLGQQHEVKARLALRRSLLLEARAVGHVDLAAQDGFEPILLGREVEVERAVHVAVVGDGAGGHAVVDGAGAEVADADRPVEERILGVAVQMDESGHGGPLQNWMSWAVTRPVPGQATSSRGGGKPLSVVWNGALHPAGWSSRGGSLAKARRA
jgi:hypothetical protein